MILQPCANVELTKIHYFENDSRPFVITREIFDNNINDARNVIRKRNIFGDKWILKINEIGNREKFKWRILIYVLIAGGFISIAVALGLYLALAKFGTKPWNDQTHSNKTAIKSKPILQTITPSTHLQMKQSDYCENCRHICLKLSESDQPQCTQPMDKNDPTGCGGHCSINTQFCQLLDGAHQIYQCSNLKNILQCPKGTFNCGNMCIKETKRCDGTVNCSNKSDEIDCVCDLETHFRCAEMTPCLPKKKQCDGIVDCWDKSDELNCKFQECRKNNTLPCADGSCMAKEKFCDGIYDCTDKSDEPQGCQINRKK